LLCSCMSTLRMTRLSVQGGGLGFISGRVYVKGGHKFREHQFSLPWVRITRCTVDLAKHRLHRRAPNTLCSAVRGHSQCSLAEECEFACSCERTVVQGPHALKTAAPHPSALSHPSATEPTGGESNAWICLIARLHVIQCHRAHAIVTAGHPTYTWTSPLLPPHFTTALAVSSGRLPQLLDTMLMAV
jgi:hypothetical protein